MTLTLPNAIGLLLFLVLSLSWVGFEMRWIPRFRWWMLAVRVSWHAWRARCELLRRELEHPRRDCRRCHHGLRRHWSHDGRTYCEECNCEAYR